MAPATQVQPLACLMLLLLRRAPGVGAQMGQAFELRQPQDKVLVKVGETLTLTCTTSGGGPTGAVKWLKGWGSGNETVYEQKSSLPRVTRVVGDSDTDFSIRIGDVHVEDAGTYYCVKFDKSLKGDVVFQRGKGTEVLVHAKPTPPVVSGPDRRAGLRQAVSFTCTAGGFYPKDIGVKWLKDDHQISALQPQITPVRTNSSYNMSSTVMVLLQEDDVRSQLVCEVQHATLPAPMRGKYQLSKALRVSPSVRVDLPSPVEVNKIVNFTCRVQGFYPEDVAVTWLENGREMKVENTSQLVKTPRGLFELRSLVEVKATEEKNGSTLTCRVVHDGQDPVKKTATLWIAAPAREGLSDRSLSDNGPNLLSSPGLWLGILLEKGLLCGLLIFLFRRGRA
ncbi:tyrosine-protein phosphatase non-receptor type substrate 1-like [Mycteria americana]|uniref:tyrosine-protein phosphatase non-receptor type substrate 1-like n=1 Tax=Mycteria americana TaxID=33587 RepID=UPI003F580722